MKLIKYNFIIITVMLIALAAIIGREAFSKTPKGINIDPIYSFKIDRAYTDIEDLGKRFAEEVRYNKWDRENTPYILASLPKGKIENNNEVQHVFRDINIFQFGTIQGAQKTYIDHRRIFAEEGNGRLYKEGGTEDDKYFISYEPAHFDYNHGVPCGIVTSPKIHVAFLKNNLFILVSYEGYFRNYDNYINEMNDDIAYAARLLKGQKN